MAVLLFVASMTFVMAPFFTPDFGGYRPSQFPVQIDDPAIQPAGYAFAIWAVIYVGLVVHAGFGLLARADDVAWDAVRWPLFLSVALGTSWLAVAQQNPIFATVQIWFMLGTALVALMRAPRIPDRWLLLSPIALYAGWLTAASGVSLGVVLIGYGVMGEIAASLTMLALVLIIAVGITVARPVALEYGFGVAWALVAVVVANFNSNVAIAIAAGAGVVVLLLVAFTRQPQPA